MLFLRAHIQSPNAFCPPPQASVTSSESEVDVEEEEHRPRPFHRRRWFRRLLLPCSVSLAFFVAGMSLYYTRPHLVRMAPWAWHAHVPHSPLPAHGLADEDSAMHAYMHICLTPPAGRAWLTRTALHTCAQAVLS
jgi:hypothetical protein